MMENYNENVKIGDIVAYIQHGDVVFHFIEVVEKVGKSIIYGKDIKTMVDISYGSDILGKGENDKNFVTVQFKPIKGQYKNDNSTKYRIIRETIRNKKGIKVKIADNLFGKFHKDTDTNWAWITMSAKTFFEEVKEIGITKEDIGKTIIL